VRTKLTATRPVTAARGGFPWKAGGTEADSAPAAKEATGPRINGSTGTVMTASNAAGIGEGRIG